MTNAIKVLTGQNNKGAEQDLQNQIAQQQQQVQSDQGQQLRLLSTQQATSDNEAAQLNKPGIGRRMLQATSGGGAATLGG